MPVKSEIPDNFILEPTPYEEASSIIKNKPVVTRRVFDRLLPELRALAFTITGIESADVLQKVRNTIAELPKGANWDEVKGKVMEELRPYFDDKTSAKRAELLMRTHGLDAYRVGQWELAQETKDALPYFKYIATMDGQTRPSHRALHGLVLPVDDPFWNSHMPPGWDWGCRCQVVQVSDYDVEMQREAEKKLPPERRRVLTEAQKRELRNGRITTGPSEYIDVRSGREKGRGGPNGLKNLRMTPKDILSRYDADIQKEFLEKLGDKPVYGLDGKYTVRDWFEGKELPNVSETPKEPTYESIEAEIKKLCKKYDNYESKDAVESALKVIEIPEAKRGTLKIGNVKHSGSKKAEADMLEAGKREFERFVNPKYFEGKSALPIAFGRSLSPRSGLEISYDSSSKRLISKQLKLIYGSREYAGKRTLVGILEEKTVSHELIHFLEAENPDLLQRSVDFVLKRAKGEAPRRLNQIYPNSRYGNSEKAYEDDWIKNGGSAYSGKEYKLGDKWIASDVLSMGVERLFSNPLKFFTEDEEYFTFTLKQVRGLW